MMSNRCQGPDHSFSFHSIISFIFIVKTTGNHYVLIKGCNEESSFKEKS